MTKPKRKRWLKADRERAVQYYLDHEGDKSYVDVASDLEIPMGTIKRWAQNYNWGEQLRQYKEDKRNRIMEELVEKRFTERVKQIELYEKMRDKVINDNYDFIRVNSKGKLIYNVGTFKAHVSSLKEINKELRELLLIEGVATQVKLEGSIETNADLSNFSEEELRKILELDTQGDESE